MSDGQEIVPYEDTGVSFWEVSGYKNTSKRISDGHALCSDMMSLIKERGEIESKYAANLRNWKKKWADHVAKGPEYGTTEAGWLGLCEEAEGLSILHGGIRDKLHNDVHAKLKTWQKEHYTKQKLGGLKQFKEMDEAFAKAQKPWRKRFDKVIAARDEYHKNCKALRTAEINERNQQGDTSISEDQKKKNLQKIEELEKKKEQSRIKYETALQEITSYNPRYMEDMTEVYEKCQDMEKERQDFLQEIMFDLQRCLNLSTDPQYSMIYSSLHNIVANADSNQDLKFWSQTHGIDMPMNWPYFEEFVPNQANLSKKVSKKPSNEDGITLTSIRKEEPAPQAYQSQISEDSNRNKYVSDSPKEHSPVQKRASTNRKTRYEPSLNPFADDDGEDLSDYDEHAEPTTEGTVNPFLNDDDEEEDDDYLVDDGRPGVPVRALYDYDGSEDDELTFKAGDEFEKLEDEDEQGWCKGRLNGRLGLYPANFCVEIN